MERFAVLFAFALLGSGAHADQLPVDDKDYGCISSEKAQAYVRTFNVEVDTFGGVELCNGNVDSKKLFNDFQIVEQGHFSGSKTNLFIKNIIPANGYYSWLQDQTASIRRDHDMPTATAYNSWGNFTMQDGWAKLSTLGRVGVLIHEARHTEGFQHYRCSQGPYKDDYLPGCDTNLTQKGSHGVEMEYYSRVVLQGDNFHPVYKQMARLMNLARANFVFNTLPMKQHEGLIALTANQAVVVDGDNSVRTRPVAKVADLRLKRSSQGATLYKGNTAHSVDAYAMDEFARDDEFTYYKLLLDGRLTGIVDAQEVDIANRRYMVALTGDGNLYTYQYGEGHWSTATRASDVAGLVTTAPNGEEGLFVVTDKDEVQSLNPQTLRRSTKIATWPEGVMDFVNWDEQHLAVQQTGGVMDLSSGKAYSPLEKFKVLQMVRAPLYDAYDLEGTTE